LLEEALPQMTVQNEPPPIPRAWPVLLALAGVGLLVAASLMVDLVVSRRVARRTAEMVGNSQRSVELVDDLREQSHRLVDPTSTAEELREVSRKIEEDASLYDPLATSPGEREERNRLQGQLAALREALNARDAQRLDTLAGQISASIDRLVRINQISAHQSADAIATAHLTGTLVDGSVGLLTLLLVGGIAFFTLRGLARQRAITARYIALLAERNRELDAFAARAAHDLRAPLSPIRGYADLLLTGRENTDEIRQSASRIRVAVDRMSRVVDDMLELSRAGRPRPGAATPSAVGAEVLEELGAELMGARVTTQLTDAQVACAPGVLAQILRNLVGNAVKFRSRQRPLTLALTAEPRDGTIELTVEDNGTGMDAESAAHAFEPYFRGRPDREIPGHGLGLAIVERTTRALGGACSLTSEPDRGTRITVRLPRA
jgi:signal transduction histidine kinase